MRLGSRASWWLLLGLSLKVHLHFHHQFHGPPVDYAGVAVASVASWLGVPGPGEPVLIAAGVFAAKHKLDIASVIVVAFAAATAGGVAGWLVGRVGGRTLLTRSGPLQRARLRALHRGDELFERHPVSGVLLTPSWIAGIHGVRTRTYMLINAGSAAAWAVGIGLGAYYAGPAVVDWVTDLGTVTAIALAVLIAGAVITEFRRRRRKQEVQLAESGQAKIGDAGQP